MAKTKTSPLTIKEPPLHVELSAPARAALLQIQEARTWNKKTAVETALIRMAKDGAK